MKRPLLERNTEENLRQLFSEAGVHLQKIKDNTNQIERETQKSSRLINVQEFSKKKDEIVNNVTKEVLALKGIMVKIQEIETNSVYLSDFKAKNEIKMKENFEFEIDRYGAVMKKISEMMITEKIKQSRLSLHHNVSESQLSNEEEGLQNEEALQQMQVVNFEEELLKERDEDIKDITKLVKNLKGMFEEVATNVQEQGKQLDKVEQNVDVTKLNVVVAEKEIQKANVISKRNLSLKLKICILFVILIIIVAVVVGVVEGVKP